MLRVNIEKKFDNPNFKINIGSVDRRKKDTIYIKVNCFVCPDKENDYNSIFKALNYNIRNDMHKQLSKYFDIFDSKFLYDLDAPSEYMKIGKKSFVELRIYLKVNDFDLSFKDLSLKANDITNNILDNFQKNLILHDIKVSKTKK